MAVHFVLLDLVTYQESLAGKPHHARRVLRVEVGGGQEQAVVGCEFHRDSSHSGTVLPPEARVYDQRAIRADDDADIGKSNDRPDMIRHLHGISREHLVSEGR